MGSTGVFRFLTQGRFELGCYKLIISKHYKGDKWAWTLVRLREPEENNKNESMPVVEYFSPDKNSVPYFYANSIQSLEYKNMKPEALRVLDKQNVGVIKQGTIVKLYEFTMGGSDFRSTMGGLDNALTISLMRCVLPIRTYDFDIAKSEDSGELVRYGIHKRTAFSGAVYYLHKHTTKLVEGFPIAMPNIGDKELGSIGINVYAVANDEINGKIEGLKYFLSKQNKRIFYTINGQTHATENKNIINTKLKLGELENHLIIEVVCDGIYKSQKHKIFLTDRERMSSTPTSKTLQEKVRDALSDNKKLKELARVIREKKAKEYIENDDSARLIVQDMVKHNPEISNLFGLGNDVRPISPVLIKPSNYQGKQFPTIFKCKQRVVEIPINSYKKIIISTDVANDYFSRLKDTGVFNWNNKDINIAGTNFKDGKFTITLKPWQKAEVGDKKTCIFSLSDCQNVEALSCEITMVVVEAKEIKPTPPPNPKNKLKIPDIVFENKDDANNFDSESGAKVMETEGNVIVYVNRNNKYLEDILARESSERKDYYVEAFRIAVGIQTLELYNKFKDCEDSPSTYEEASSAIARSVIAIIQNTGKQICNY